MYQAKSGVKKISLYHGGGGRGGKQVCVPPKKSCSKWAETYFGFGIFEIWWILCVLFTDRQTHTQTHKHTNTRRSDQISRSARETERLKIELFTAGHSKSEVNISLLLATVDIQIYNKNSRLHVKRLFSLSQRVKTAKQKSKDSPLHVTSMRNHYVSQVFERIYGLTDRDIVYEHHTNNFASCSEIYCSDG